MRRGQTNVVSLNSEIPGHLENKTHLEHKVYYPICYLEKKTRLFLIREMFKGEKFNLRRINYYVLIEYFQILEAMPQRWD